MKRNKTLFLSIIFLLCSTIAFIIGLFSNHSYYSSIANLSVVRCQFNQFLSIILLFIIGFTFIILINQSLSIVNIFLLSFPAGICLWCFSCEFLLLIGIPLSFLSAFGMILLILCLILVVRRKKTTNHTIPFSNIIPLIFLSIGIALLTSSGFIYIISNYDSYTYFSDYGKAIAIFGNYRSLACDDAFTLTNIGQFLPLVSTYSTFWGLDTAYHIHSCLLLVVILAFFSFVYQISIENKNSEKKSFILSFLFSVMLVSCSPFFLFSNWFLSNSWILFFLVFIYSVYHSDTPINANTSKILICMFSLAITMLRKDGLVIVSFIFICFGINQYSEKITTKKERFSRSHKLLLLFLPSALYEILYIFYLKYVLNVYVYTAAGTSLLSRKNQLLLFACFFFVALYLLLLFNPVEKIFKSKLPLVATISLLIGFVFICLIKIPKSIEYIDAWSRNFFGIGFGYSLLLIGLLLTLIIVTSNKFDFDMLLVFGYILLIFIIYQAKGNTEQNIDNSGLRAIYQIIPIIFMVSAKRIIPYFSDSK